MSATSSQIVQEIVYCVPADAPLIAVASVIWPVPLSAANASEPANAASVVPLDSLPALICAPVGVLNHPEVGCAIQYAKRAIA